MRLAMQEDPSVFLLGEDIGVFGGFGGGFTVTLGLSEEFGHDRVMNTPMTGMHGSRDGECVRAICRKVIWAALDLMQGG